MIALCGMGGVGKTHMMERLKKAVEDFKMFYRVVKVVVGQNTEVASLQHFVSEIMGGALTETTGDARAESLKNRFAVMSKEGEKKILVILDDVWEVLDLKDIGLSSPLPNGLKLLLTSRDAYVCSQMGVEKSSIFTLTFSYEQDAKALFYESAGLDHCDADPELHEIAEQFVDRCHGIPIVIRTLAISLRGESKYAWEDQLRRLKHFLGNDNIDVVFRLSFENLSEKNKAICVLSGLFPEDTDIPMEELMRYAWGLKLLPAVSTIAEARQIIETSANTLVYARLLTRSDHVGCVRTHDLLHDFALSTDKQAFIDHNNMPENDSGESLERIYIDCTGMSEFPVPFDYPNLKLLKLMGEKQLLKFPQDFYDRMKNLEVVAFERIDDPLLPHFSFNLQTLRLDSCSLMDDVLSFLENLNNLEILIFARCGIRKLPSTVGKLRKLKLLDVTGCSDDLCIDDGVFEDLDMLEELYLRVDGSKAICFTDANCEELEILSRKLCALEVELYDNKLHIKDESFKNLKKFKISMGCLLDDNSIESSLDDNTLKLVTNLSDLLECKINELFLKTNILYLQVNDMKNLEEVSMRYSFINLRKLEISNCADLTFLFTVQVASDLTKLRDLKVSSCPVLETMIDGKSDGGSMIMFPNLKSLSLNDLPCLMRLCNMDNGLDLRELVDLTLDGLPNFTTIYPDNAEQQYSFFNNQVQLPTLEKLKISSMNKLKQIWPCEITTISSSEEEDDTNISKLREIEVEGCDNLKNLFPCNPLPLLNQLKELCVKNCGSVEVLFDMDLTFAGNIKEVRSSLESIRVEKLKKLRKIWRIKGANKSGLAIHCFQDVKAIHIQNCEF